MCVLNLWHVVVAIVLSTRSVREILHQMYALSLALELWLCIQYRLVVFNLKLLQDDEIYQDSIILYEYTLETASSWEQAGYGKHMLPKLKRLRRVYDIFIGRIYY